MSDRQTIQTLLDARKCKAAIVGESTGPRVTRYRLEIAPETPVGRVTRLSGDLQALLGRSVRVYAPADGLAGVVIEVPRLDFRPLGATNLLARVSEPLMLVLGYSAEGLPVLRALRAMPHFLVAGSTGSGKSVSLNCCILSLLQHPPQDVRLALIDMKRVELAQYAGIPHLVRPVATDKPAARALLRQVLAEVERRYKMLGARGLRSWDELRHTERQPYVVLVIDELAEVVLGDEYSSGILQRIAQLGRAAGVHLVMAIQRADSRVLGGILKGQIPTRLSFAVVSATDSRVILDVKGAETLLGKGDGLLREPTGLTRIQGALYEDADIAAALARWPGKPDYWVNDEPKPYRVIPVAPVVLAPATPLPAYATRRGRAATNWAIALAMLLALAVIIGAMRFGGL